MNDPIVGCILSIIIGGIIVALGLWQRKTGNPFFILDISLGNVREGDLPALAAESSLGVVIAGVAIIGMGPVMLVTGDALSPVNLILDAFVLVGIIIVFIAIRKYNGKIV